MDNQSPHDTMQVITMAEEVIFKGTLVVLTIGACVRFTCYDIIATIRGIQRERGIKARRAVKKELKAEAKQEAVIRSEEMRQ